MEAAAKGQMPPAARIPFGLAIDFTGNYSARFRSTAAVAKRCVEMRTLDVGWEDFAMGGEIKWNEIQTFNILRFRWWRCLGCPVCPSSL